MTCTFFGHRYVPQKIEPTLRSTLIDLIENHGADLFYVGNHGDFDAMVRDTSDPDRLNPDFLFENDWLHLNASGYELMGKGIDVNLFR